ncbi:hypothetical protein HA402_003849 [Bradysia odoriphaga]|nr:hypothetical protein HA402_003849 [Bradysia odoriphaga]
MPSILKQEKRSVLKRRNVSHLSVVNIETVQQQNKVSFAKFNFMEIDTETRNESFFYSVWPVIYVAQFMGFMPVQGIRTGDPFKFEFRWKTFRVMITMMYFVCSASMATMYLNRIARLGISAKNIVGFVFYTFCLFCGILFLFLAQRWKDLALMWHRYENIFLNLPYKECGWKLSTKIRITSVVILFLAIVEHLMAILNSGFNFHTKLVACQPNINDKWKYFFLNEYPHVFMLLPYHFLLTILIEWSIISFTFGWNYMDTFIMLTSIGLAIRFKQINQRLEEIKSEPMDESLWAEIRHHYVLLCELVETVDQNLAAITLLCCTNNLYFICYQLLNVFNKLPHFMNFLYFWYSLLYLIGRTTGVFLIASSINDAAKYPVTFVRQRQTTEWCSEIHVRCNMSVPVIITSNILWLVKARFVLLQQRRCRIFRMTFVAIELFVALMVFHVPAYVTLLRKLHPANVTTVRLDPVVRILLM